eukprot:gene12690-12821_t
MEQRWYRMLKEGQFWFELDEAAAEAEATAAAGAEEETDDHVSYDSYDSPDPDGASAGDGLRNADFTIAASGTSRRPRRLKANDSSHGAAASSGAHARTTSRDAAGCARPPAGIPSLHLLDPFAKRLDVGWSNTLPSDWDEYATWQALTNELEERRANSGLYVCAAAQAATQPKSPAAGFYFRMSHHGSKLHLTTVLLQQPRRGTSGGRLEAALAISRQPTANGYADGAQIKNNAIIGRDDIEQSGGVMARMLRDPQNDGQQVQTASRIAQNGGEDDRRWRDGSFFGPEDPEQSGGAFAGPGIIGRRLAAARKVTDTEDSSADDTDWQGGRVYGDEDPNRFTRVFSRWGLPGSS